MTKRSYNRRSDEEIIAELEARIRKIETRRTSKERADAPVIKEVPKVKKSLARFAQLCMDHGRADLSNTVVAFLATIERQARQGEPEAKLYGNHQPHPPQDREE